MNAASYSPSLWRRLWYTRLSNVLRGRFDAGLDWRQQIALAELPVELANAVVEVVGRSRLWRDEKLAVANELVAHFQDGLEAGRSPQELLGTFGDLKAAAQLIRRAKRRNRPIIWHVWHYGWMALLMLAALYVVTGIWMSFDRPQIRVNYLAEINKVAQAVPAGERAWPAYREALLALGFDQSEGDTSAARFLASEAKPGDVDWPSQEKFLNDHAEAIAKLRAAAMGPTLGFVAVTAEAGFSGTDQKLFGRQVPNQQATPDNDSPLQDSLISVMLPLGQLRSAGRTLRADALRAAAGGDGATAYTNVMAMLGVSRHSQETPFFISLLTSEAIQAKARNVVRDVLADYPNLWAGDQLQRVAHAFASSRVDWQRGFEGERMFFYDIMQRIYTDNGAGDGHLAFRVADHVNVFQMIESLGGDSPPANSAFSNTTLALLTLPAANIVVASRKEMADAYEKLMGRAQAEMEKPLWLQDKNAPFESEVRALQQGPTGRIHFWLLELLFPGLDALRNRIALSDGERDGLFIGLALELYHRQHHQWPSSLADLSPQWLPETPVDRITGKPLKYKIVDDRPLVYSVGPDHDDDGGRPTEKDVRPCSPTSTADDGDWIIWTTARKSH